MKCGNLKNLEYLKNINKTFYIFENLKNYNVWKSLKSSIKIENIYFISQNKNTNTNKTYTITFFHVKIITFAIFLGYDIWYDDIFFFCFVTDIFHKKWTFFLAEENPLWRTHSYLYLKWNMIIWKYSKYYKNLEHFEKYNHKYRHFWKSEGKKKWNSEKYKKNKKKYI